MKAIGDFPQYFKAPPYAEKEEVELPALSSVDLKDAVFGEVHCPFADQSPFGLALSSSHHSLLPTSSEQADAMRQMLPQRSEA